MPDARTAQNYDSSHVISGGIIPVLYSPDPNAEIRIYKAKGFDVIGYSSFFAPESKVNLKQAQSVGQDIGAHVILFKSRYKDTLNGASPVSIPNNTYSTTSGTATAYGNGGTATVNGSSTTNTYGTQTLLVPYSISRSDYYAVYLAKTKHRIGLYTISLNDEERKALNTNSAVKVDIVIEDTPAFLANIFSGDYLLKINDDAVTSTEIYTSLLNKFEGQDVKFHLIRDGKSLEKTMHVKTIMKQ